MSEIDIVKEKINYLKVWLGILVVTTIGLIGWISSNYEGMDNLKMGLSIFSVMVLVVGIHFLNKVILKKINSLGDL